MPNIDVTQCAFIEKSKKSDYPCHLSISKQKRAHWCVCVMCELVHKCRFMCVFICVCVSDNAILLHDNSFYAPDIVTIVFI